MYAFIPILFSFIRSTIYHVNKYHDGKGFKKKIWMGSSNFVSDFRPDTEKKTLSFRPNTDRKENIGS